MDNLFKQLREQGVAILRGAFSSCSLTPIQEAAGLCFDAIETGARLPAWYQVNRFSDSVLLQALLDFGCGSFGELLRPLTEAGLEPFLSEVMDCALECRMSQSWVRKKYAPRQTPDASHPLQDWHQDGALGVRFPLEAGPAPPITRLLTCWLPLNPCGGNAPGLEFIRRRQEALLHFTELNDATLRRRFTLDEFWAPELDFGDGLVFLNGTLHRTFVRPAMERHRVSVEYRWFPL